MAIENPPIDFPLCDDYRSFYEQVADSVDTHTPLPALERVARQGRPLAERLQRESDREFWGVAQIFGRRAFDSFHKNIEDQFWHESFTRYGYVIALSRHGDPIVQAHSGKHMGRIFLTDHNFYNSWEDQLVHGEDLDEIETELAALGIESVGDMSADEFFDLMTIDAEMDGLFIVLASSFDEFYESCCREYGAV